MWFFKKKITLINGTVYYIILQDHRTITLISLRFALSKTCSAVPHKYWHTWKAIKIIGKGEAAVNSFAQRWRGWKMLNAQKHSFQKASSLCSLDGREPDITSITIKPPWTVLFSFSTKLILFINPGHSSVRRITSVILLFNLEKEVDAASKQDPSLSQTRTGYTNHQQKQAFLSEWRKETLRKK